jgi:lysophospholipase L1-like esterase
MTKLNRWATVALTGILILTGLLVGLGIIEIGLRIAGIEYRPFYTVDQHRGWVQRSLVSGWFRSEGESYVQTNSDGFNDKEHTKVKPENTLRIALLGDSFVDALQVPLEQGFAAVIERELNGCQTLAGQKVEVIKFGVNGHGTAQELITLREKVWQYSPDLVLLAFFTGNDLIDNSRNLIQKSLNDLSLLRPFFIFEDGHLVLDTSYVNTDEYRSKASWWSQTYLKVTDKVRILQVWNQIPSLVLPLFKQTTGQQNQMLGSSYDIYKPPTDPDWQQAWQVTEGILSLMHDEVVAKGTDFVVVTLSNPHPAYPDPTVRQKYLQASGATDWFYPEKRIGDFGEREGFSVINLGPTFQAYAEQNHVCLYGFDNAAPCEGHWNAVGHQLAGKMIASKLCEKFSSIATNQVQ